MVSGLVDAGAGAVHPKSSVLPTTFDPDIAKVASAEMPMFHQLSHYLDRAV